MIVKIDIIIIQEFFINPKEILYIQLNFYELQYKKRNIGVIAAVEKSLINKIVYYHKQNFVKPSNSMLRKNFWWDFWLKKTGKNEKWYMFKIIK